jgi:hypothetical protein
VTYDAGVALVDGTATSVYYMPMAAGNYEFMANYSGDSNYLPSSSGEDAELLLVENAETNTTTCLSACHIVLGCSVCDKAFVTAEEGSSIPTGTVDFQVRFDSGEWMTYDAGVELVNGVACSISYTPMAAGHYDFRAVYNGDVSHLSSMSGDCAEPLCVEKAPSQTTTDLGVICHIPEPIEV